MMLNTRAQGISCKQIDNEQMKRKNEQIYSLKPSWSINIQKPDPLVD